jgi:hypothetical protein
MSRDPRRPPELDQALAGLAAGSLRAMKASRVPRISIAKASPDSVASRRQTGTAT